MLMYPLILLSCMQGEVIQKRFTLLNEDSLTVVFPQHYGGKVVLVGYIYTHCPDICPMITENMVKVYKELRKRGELEDVMFVLISFDPKRDKPSVLKKYLEIRDIYTEEWDALTGEPSVIDSLMKEMDIVVIKTPSEFTETGEEIYFITHTDRIHLLDRNGRIVKSYKGSTLPTDKVVEDILKLK